MLSVWRCGVREITAHKEGVAEDERRCEAGVCRAERKERADTYALLFFGDEVDGGNGP